MHAATATGAYFCLGANLPIDRSPGSPLRANEEAYPFALSLSKGSLPPTHLYTPTPQRPQLPKHGNGVTLLAEFDGWTETRRQNALASPLPQMALTELR